MSSETPEKSGKIKPWHIYACGALGIGLLVGWGACWLLQYLQTRGEKIDQSALATFAAGLMAVGAALFVGVRQTAIQDRQAEIQERQTNVQLLDRRAEAIKQISAFYRHHLSPHTPVPEEEWTIAYDALNQAQLVYPEALTDLFGTCLQNLAYCKEHMKAASDFHRNGDLDKAVEEQGLSNALFTTLMNDFGRLRKSMIAHARIDL